MAQENAVASQNRRQVHTNWIAVFSYTASVAVSLAIWAGLFHAMRHLVK
jgi:hypothetical protein